MIRCVIGRVFPGMLTFQVWGFELIDGERRYTRRVAVTKNGQVELARLVYTFQKRRTE